MGKFAEFCKGETMEAFLLLLLPAGTKNRRLDQDQTQGLIRTAFLLVFCYLGPPTIVRLLHTL